jgi:alpha-tubulin suppressor-like RCC1 family protein
MQTAFIRAGGRRQLILRIATGLSLVALVCGMALAAFGASHRIALAATGVAPVPGGVYSWGRNDGGQLGNGTAANQSAPVAASLPRGVTVSAIAGGRAHTLALAANGTVYAWGANDVGQLGNGSTTTSVTPVRVRLPHGVTAKAIAAASSFSLALAVDGTVYAWGANTLGQLGNGSTVALSALPVPVRLPAGASAAAIAAGGNDGLALVGGHVYAWGDDTDGALGNGTTGRFSATPVRVSLPSGTTAMAVAAGGAHGLALSTSGTVYSWGSNQLGHLGNGTSVADSATPVPVSLPKGVSVTAIADGGGHALALDAAGRVYAWGDGRSGQLGSGVGDADYDDICNSDNDDVPLPASNVPVQSHLPAGVTVTSIAAGACSSVALAADGTVYAWGDDTFGELGNGATTTFFTTPVAVHLPSGVRAAAVMAGTYHAALILTELEGIAYPNTTTVLEGTNSAGQTFILTIPPGAVTDPTTFTANQVALSTLPALPKGVQLIGVPVSFQAFDDITDGPIDHFGASLTLAFSYPSSVSGTGQLTLATTDGTSWQTIPSTTTSTCCFVDGPIDHFSAFAVWLVPGPVEIESDLLRFFASGDITSKSLMQGLQAKLQAAAAARAAGHCGTAGNIYQAFINQVRAEAGKHIDTTAANTLIAEAQKLIAHCP